MFGGHHKLANTPKARHVPQNGTQKLPTEETRLRGSRATPKRPLAGRKNPRTIIKERQPTQSPAKKLILGGHCPKKVSPGLEAPLRHPSPQTPRSKTDLSHDVPRRGHRLPLLACGDVEPNPGPCPTQRCLLCPPPGKWPAPPPAPTEDYQLYPYLFRDIPGRLGTSTPTLDAFAAPWNSQLPDFWCRHTNAFRQSWLGVTPLWANPPFSLLPLVLQHLKSKGGHVLLVCPSYSRLLTSFGNLSKASYTLPKNTSLFLRGGVFPMPPPAWSVWVFHIDVQPTPTSQKGAPLQTESPKGNNNFYSTDMDPKQPTASETPTQTPAKLTKTQPTPADHTVTPCVVSPDTHLAMSHTANKYSPTGCPTPPRGTCDPCSGLLPRVAPEVSLDLMDVPMPSPTNSCSSADVLHNGLPYSPSIPNSPVSLTSSIDLLDQQDQTDIQQSMSPSGWATQPLPTRQTTCWERQNRLLQDGDIESNPGPRNGPSAMGPQAWEYWLETTFAAAPISRFWVLVTADPGAAGPSSTAITTTTTSWSGLAASCKWCDKVVWFTTLDPLLNHSCPPHHLLPNKMPTFGTIWDSPPSEPDSEHCSDGFLDQLQAEHEKDQHYWQDGKVVWPIQGRGSTPTCGDVEPNPGPSSAETSITPRPCQQTIRTTALWPVADSRL
jgi:hypothetical protein